MAEPWVFSGSTTFDSSRCAKCGTVGETSPYVGEGGAVGYIHGQYEFWCRRCTLAAQIAYAEDQAAGLAALREKLAELDG